MTAYTHIFILDGHCLIAAHAVLVLPPSKMPISQASIQIRGGEEAPGHPSTRGMWELQGRLGGAE